MTVCQTPADWPDRDGALAHGLVHPRLFRDGANEVAAYLVDGTPAAPVLHELAVDGMAG